MKKKSSGRVGNLSGIMGQKGGKQSAPSSDDLRENMGQGGSRPKGPGVSHDAPLHTIMGQ